MIILVVNIRDFELKPEDSKFIDFQILRLQELPEDLPPGQLPHYIDVTTRQDLVDNSRPGDRIILTGVVSELSKNQLQEFREVTVDYTD